MTIDNAEIRSLYEKYGHMIYGRCLRILRDPQEAADAMQAVFLKFLEARDSIIEPKAATAWLFTSATRYCFNLLREAKRMKYAEEPDQVGIDPQTENRISCREILSRLFTINDMQTKEAVYYTYVEELEQKDIQRLTGMSPATIRRHLARFKQRCKQMKPVLDLP
jgi:RNA polymerase sigma-70 factor, ECF subfamily